MFRMSKIRHSELSQGKQEGRLNGSAVLARLIGRKMGTCVCGRGAMGSHEGRVCGGKVNLSVISC